MKLTLGLIALIIIGCGDATEPAHADLYELSSIDGRGLPSTAQNMPTVAAGALEIAESEVRMTLNAANGTKLLAEWRISDRQGDEFTLTGSKLDNARYPTELSVSGNVATVVHWYYGTLLFTKGD